MRRGACFGWLAALALLAGAGAARSARADDDPLARASDLRNAAAEDWNQGRYTEAAAKLEQASALYDAAEGEAPLDRAITWRAWIWNLVRCHEVGRALAVYDRLLALAAQDPAAADEADTAFGAMWEDASRRESLDASRRTLDPVREAARRHGVRRVEAQATHSLGSLARNFGEQATAVALFEEAVALRREIGDAVGMGWSLNNLANVHLTAGAVERAMAPLAEAHRTVHEERVVAPQGAVAWNLDKAIELFGERRTAAGPAWLRACADVARRSGQGALRPASHLEREALRLAGATGMDDDALRAMLAAIVALPADPAVPEIRADLVLRAARVAVDRLGAYQEARGWLQSLDLGQGPCRPHLAARLALGRALAWAQPGRRWDDWYAATQDARAKWRTVGDWQGHRDALDALVAAGRRAGMLDHMPDLAEERASLAQDGRPGGEGGTAQAGGDRSKARDLPLDAAVLRIAMLPDGRVRIEDEVARFGLTREIHWRESHVALNGIGLTFFGGYVAVREADYGGGAAAVGASGGAGLDDVPRFVPIPARAALLVQKNGGVRYDAGR